MKKIDFFQRNYLSLNCAFGLVEWSFENPGSFFEKKPNTFCSVSKSDEKCKLVSEEFFLQKNVFSDT